MTLVDRVCEACGRTFQIKQAHLKYRSGRFCSHRCGVVVFHTAKRPTHKPKPLAERLWAKVQKTETCWIWTGGKQQGYGVLARHRGTHRVSWELHFGPIPEGMFVCHHCDNRACVRPDHLFLGTLQDNNADMRQKHRHAWGAKSGFAKLTPAQVEDVRANYIPELGWRPFAAKYGISRQSVYRIVRRETYVPEREVA